MRLLARRAACFVGLLLIAVAACRASPAAPAPAPSPSQGAGDPAPSPSGGGLGRGTATPTRPPPVVTTNGDSQPEIGDTSEDAAVYLPLAAHDYTAGGCDGAPLAPATLTVESWTDGEAAIVDGRPAIETDGRLSLHVWQPLTLSFVGPAASESDLDPNPFLDYRLQVSFRGPSGQVYDVPGHYAGDGRGGGAGRVWQAHFAADEPGRWRYCASFRAGPGVAVSLDPAAGQPTAFDRANGGFEARPAEPNAPEFFRWGRLEYVGGHYLKFRDGPYWLKGGTNSPENFLGYAGFDNTVDQGGLVEGFLHQYAPHVVDWRPGDPNFSGEGAIDGRGIIGALNYLGDRGVNSLYFLPLNLGGDGQDSYPFLSPGGGAADNSHYDVSKLHQWGIVWGHAQRRGIALHVVLGEVEPDNRYWLDEGGLGPERMLFYRELVARLAHLPAVKWNISEEIPFTPEETKSMAAYLAALDWADHPIAVHNPAGLAGVYEALRGDPNLSATSFQYDGDRAGGLVEEWRAASAAAGRPWVIEMDENNPAGVGLTPDNGGDLRRRILYDVYFSGAGGIEWYLGYHGLPVGGDPNLEDFRTREHMWNGMLYARRVLERLPFWRMSPADELLTGENEAYGGGEVLAMAGRVYAVYLPSAEPSGTLAAPPGRYRLRWYDPRTGEFIGGTLTAAAGADGLALGLPPNNAAGDWVVLVRRAGDE